MERVRTVWRGARERLGRRTVASQVVIVNLLGIALVTALLVGGSLLRERSLAFQEEARQFEDHYTSFLSQIADDGEAAQGLATTFARDEEIQAALAAQNRAELTRLTLPTWLTLDAELDVPFCQFVVQPGVSFLRLHDLAVNGDSLGRYRHTILDVLADRQPTSGLEIGRGGLGIRGVAPVWYSSDFIGAVEFGLGFDNSYLRAYAEDYHLDMLIYLRPVGGKIALLDGASLGDPVVGSDLLRYATSSRRAYEIPMAAVSRAIETGTATISDMSFEGERYGVFSGPLRNYLGETIGAVVMVRSRSETLMRILMGQAVNLVIGLALMAVAGVLTYRSTRRLMAPVGEMSMGAERAARGDLSRTITVQSHNEVGRLAEAFNAMILGLRNLLADVDEASVGLSSSSERLASEMEEMYASVEQVSIAVGEMAGGASTQAMRVEEVSYAMGQLAEATAQIARNAHRTGEVSVTARQMVDEAREVSRTLERRSQRIEEIVVAVDKIADQTNLLALNASIEAARAGEAGLGFAVVGQEVRRLAENSARLVGEIADLSQAIGQDLAEVRSKMDAAQQAVDQTATIAQQTSAASTDQEGSTDAMVVAINEIAAVAEESAASTEEIAVTVEQQAATIDHIAGAAQTLAELAGQLRESVSRLRAEGEDADV